MVCLLAFRLVISDFFGLSIFLVLFKASDEFLCEGWYNDSLTSFIFIEHTVALF